jgi:inosine triphosphate pyrophosphatase
MVSLMSKRLFFITGNANKLKEAKEILVGYDVDSKKIDLPELQGEPEYIASEKAKLAAEMLKEPVFVEDVSLCFNALNGLPGPYIKDFLAKLGREGLVKLLSGYEDKSAYAVCMVGYCEPGKDSVVLKGRVDGKIVPIKGESDFGWDPIFLPDGFEKTFAEMSAEQKNEISHRKKALLKFKEFLEGC